MADVEKPEKVEKMLYKKQKKAEVRKEKVETAKRERNEVLDAMIANATDNPSYKTLTRIIQVVKAVFNEKMDQDIKKKKGRQGEEDEEMEDEEEKEKTDAQKHKKFSQSLQPAEYQRLV